MGLAGAQPGAGGSVAGRPAAPDLGGGSDFGGNFGQRMPMLIAIPRQPAHAADHRRRDSGRWWWPASFMWSRQPDYRVLFSNLSDRDGGAIVAALQQGNIPYKFADAGRRDPRAEPKQVHETRLRLASQGLPKSGSVGFELMDNQKFGISQFAEQINYQRALEGELERTIESISSVKSARVHLAIPKPTVFVRDKEAPTASVLLNLYPGRALDEGQVAGDPAHGVVGRAGHAGEERDHRRPGRQPAHAANAPATASTRRSSSTCSRSSATRRQRIDAILAPLFGAGNAHSQVSADIDFSKLEQTAESYGPNAQPAAGGDPQPAIE